MDVQVVEPADATPENRASIASLARMDGSGQCFRCGVAIGSTDRFAICAKCFPILYGVGGGWSPLKKKARS